MMNRQVVFGLAIATSTAIYILIADRSDKSPNTDVTSVLAPTSSVQPVRALPKVTSVSRAPAAQVKPELPQAAHSLLKELERLEKCYETDCGYARSYPQAYDYAVGRDIKKALFDLAELARTQHCQFSELSRAGQKLLLNDDGHVKEGALRLLGTQAPSSESLHAILAGIIDDTDAELIEPALRELRRYENSSDRTQIHERLSATLLTGSPFVAEKISQNLGPFLDASSFAYYSRVESQASVGSRIRSNLHAQLFDFQKRQSGG